MANSLALKSQLDAQDFQERRLAQQDALRAEDRQFQREEMDFKRQLQLDAAQRKKLEDAANDTTQTALAVLNAAEPDRPAVYQTGLQYLKSRGHDVSKLPPAYSPGMDGMLKFYVQKAESVTDFLKRQAETPQPMGPAAGGSAPSGYSPTAFMQGRIKRGDDPITAAAWAGNVEHESSFNPAAFNPKDPNGGSHGLIQWNGPRAQALRQFAAARGGNPADPELQQDFLQSEIDADPQFKAMLAAAPTAQEKAALISMKFIRPAGGQPEAMSRGQTATKYAMGTPPPSMVAQGANAAPMPNVSPQQVGALPGTPAQMPGGFTPTNMPAQSVPGGLPQVAQGDAVTGQGDVMAPPRAAPNADDPITLRAYVNSKIPGAQVMGVQGVPVYDKQGRVLIRLPNGQTDTMEVPKAKEKVGPSGPFGGSSVEAQALNMLVSNGTLTPQQAAELAAGKTITNPADGSVIFMTPSGIFGQKPGQPPQPVGGALGGPAAAPQGAITITPPKPEKMTEGQSAAALYADRMVDADKIIQEVEQAGLDPVGKGLERVPFGNYLQSADYQRFEQARRDFVNAVLRRESGAVISDQEFANAERQYFPQPGDKPDTLRQKAANRKVAIEGITRGAGPFYKPKGNTQAPAAPPKVGDVQDGYLFKGGDPSKPESWEKVQ